MQNMGIRLDYASVYHPQTNGQVEHANGLIMSGIKPKLVRSLKESDMHWVEELDSVLWGLPTTPNRTTGYTPFLWCTTPDMKSITGLDSAVLTGLASIHLVNLSTMTNRYFFLWLPPLRGPTMSSPQTAKG